MQGLRRECTEQIRKNKIEDLVLQRRLKLIQQPRCLMDEPRDEQCLGELPNMNLLIENSLKYFMQVGVLIEQLQITGTHPAKIMAILKHTREVSTSPSFPVERFIESKLPDYLFQLIQTDAMVLKEFVLA